METNYLNMWLNYLKHNFNLLNNLKKVTTYLFNLPTQPFTCMFICIYHIIMINFNYDHKMFEVRFEPLLLSPHF